MSQRTARSLPKDPPKLLKHNSVRYLVVSTLCILLLFLTRRLVFQLVGYRNEVQLLKQLEKEEALRTEQNFSIARREEEANISKSEGLNLHDNRSESDDCAEEGCPKVYEIQIPVTCQDTNGLYCQQKHLEATTSLLSSEMHHAFDRDGVIALRGLLSLPVLQDLDTDSHRIMSIKNEKGQSFFSVLKMGPLFTNYEETKNGGFINVALHSLLPVIAAELMNFTSDTNNNNISEVIGEGSGDDTLRDKSGVTVRMLRDVFLAKDDEENICGWHVDDLGFWPATASSPGINAWIALDDMPSFTGGGLALAVGSHTASWRHRAYELIGATPTLPEEGYKSIEDMFAKRSAVGTCNLKDASPELYEEIEKGRRVYDLKKGDVIFHARWLFHRTVPFDRTVVQNHYRNSKNHDEKRQKEPLMYRRYSIRYVPGFAQLPRGYGAELSTLWNEENSGRTLDEVVEKDGPWYPKCWPNGADDDEMKALPGLIKEKFPVAMKTREERVKEILPYFKQGASSSTAAADTTETKKLASNNANVKKEASTLKGNSSWSKPRQVEL